MSKTTLWHRHAVRALVVALTVLTAAFVAPANQAQAAPYGVSARVGAVAVTYTANERGRPYRMGGTTPARGFDCSGLVTYVYKTRLHRNLPRTADAQYRATLRISKKSMRPGDLVFFLSGGRAYHVGVYAGHNKMWHAAKPGTRVKLVTIWTTQWVGGRVR